MDNFCRALMLFFRSQTCHVVIEFAKQKKEDNKLVSEGKTGHWHIGKQEVVRGAISVQAYLPG